MYWYRFAEEVVIGDEVLIVSNENNTLVPASVTGIHKQYMKGKSLSIKIIVCQSWLWADLGLPSEAVCVAVCVCVCVLCRAEL